MGAKLTPDANGESLAWSYCGRGTYWTPLGGGKYSQGRGARLGRQVCLDHKDGDGRTVQTWKCSDDTGWGPQVWTFSQLDFEPLDNQST